MPLDYREDVVSRPDCWGFSILLRRSSNTGSFRFKKVLRLNEMRGFLTVMVAVCFL